MFVVDCLLCVFFSLAACCLLFCVWFLLVGVCGSLFVVCSRSWFVGCWLSVVGCCLVVVVRRRCLLFGVWRRSLFVVCCRLIAVCCLLSVVG